MTNKFIKKRDKIRAQIKSRFYYLFWGAATISVVTGQILVGTGYRRMADTNDAISADINLLIEVLIDPRLQETPVDTPFVMPIIR